MAVVRQQWRSLRILHAVLIGAKGVEERNVRNVQRCAHFAHVCVEALELLDSMVIRVTWFIQLNRLGKEARKRRVVLKHWSEQDHINIPVLDRHERRLKPIEIAIDPSTCDQHLVDVMCRKKIGIDIIHYRRAA